MEMRLILFSTYAWVPASVRPDCVHTFQVTEEIIIIEKNTHLAPPLDIQWCCESLEFEPHSRIHMSIMYIIGV